MHPEIKKFYLDGQESFRTIGPNTLGTWHLYIMPNCYTTIIKTIYDGDKYCYNDEWYSEEEMFKIIKMKAFI